MVVLLLPTLNVQMYDDQIVILFLVVGHAADHNGLQTAH